MITPTDCRRCGACCFSTAERFVPVTGADWCRLGSHAAKVAHFIGNRAFMRMEGGHCVALAVRVAPGGGSDFFCTVYEWRPQVCRDLERGSAQCEGERSREFSILDSRFSSTGRPAGVCAADHGTAAGPVVAWLSSGSAAASPAKRAAKNVALGPTAAT